MFISRNRRYNILIKPFASMDVEKVPGYQTRAPDIFRRSFEVQITRLEACGQLQPLNASAKNVHRHVERERNMEDFNCASKTGSACYLSTEIVHRKKTPSLNVALEWLSFDFYDSNGRTRATR